MRRWRSCAESIRGIFTVQHRRACESQTGSTQGQRHQVHADQGFVAERVGPDLSGPAHHAGYPDTPFPQGCTAGAQGGIGCTFQAARGNKKGTVVREQNHQGLFCQIQCVELIEYAPDAVVQGREHRVVALSFVARIGIVAVAGKGIIRGLPITGRMGRLVFGIGVVGGIEGDIAEEGTAPVAFDELTGRICKDEGTVAPGFSRFGVAIEVVAPVVEVGVVVAVAGDVAEVLVKAPIRGSAACDKAEIPFAKAADYSLQSWCNAPIATQSLS